MADKKTTAADIHKLIKEKEVKYVDVRFTDMRGKVSLACAFALGLFEYLINEVARKVLRDDTKTDVIGDPFPRRQDGRCTRHAFTPRATPTDSERRCGWPD